MLKLTNIKHSAFASQETHYFEATLLFKGHVVATVSNSGHGGPTDIWFRKNQEQVLDYADKFLRLSDDPEYQDLYDNSTPYTLIELWCGHEVNNWLARKDLKRMMSKRVLYTCKGEEGIYQTKIAKNAAQRDAWIPQVEAWKTTDQVLNSMPIDDAFALFEART